MNDSKIAFFLSRALNAASRSPDPDTKVGAVLVTPRGEIIGIGCNHFPTGIRVTPERLADRETKLQLMIHAEMNALLWAGMAKASVIGSTLYLAATDDTGRVWGGRPAAGRR